MPRPFSTTYPQFLAGFAQATWQINVCGVIVISDKRIGGFNVLQG